MKCILVIILILLLSPEGDDKEIVTYQLEKNSHEECVQAGYNQLDRYAQGDTKGYFTCIPKGASDEK